MYKILKNIIEMDDYSVQKLSKSQPPTPFQWNTVEGTELNVDDCIGGKGKIAVKGNTSQATSILPEGYTQVEYIESTGSQYIDTGYLGSDETKIIVEFAYTNRAPSNNGFIFGSRINNSNKNMSVTFDPEKVYIGRGNSFDTVNIVTELNVKYKLIYEKTLVKLDNNVISNSEVSSFDSDYSLYILGCNERGQKIRNTRAKIYSFKIYDNQQLVMNFIPCKNDNNEIGLYDLVSNTFFTNAGTGTFVAGNEVTIPNPDYPQEIKKVTGDNKIKCTRKNLLPSTVFEFCTITSSGEKIIGNSRICSDFIKVKKLQDYTLRSINQFGFIGVAFYDSNKKYIDRTVGNNIKSIKVSIPAQCSYVKVFGEYRSGTEQSIIAFKEHKIQLELGIATDYEEYEGKEFELSLGNIELCKTSDHEDVLFKNEQSSEYYNSNLIEGAWYKKNTFNKVVDIAGSTGITINDIASNADFYSECGGTISNKTITYESAISDSNTIYYPIDTPTYIQITDETLISQLEALNKAKWFKGVNHWWTETNNLEPVLKGTYRQAINE